MAQQPTHGPKNTPQAFHFDTTVSVNVLQKPLPPAIAILVDKAAAYSSDDLQRLTYLLRDLDHGPRLAKHPRIIKLFLGYLKGRERFINNHGEVYSEAGLYGIRAIIRILEAARAVNDEDSFLIQSLTQSWPDIWFWMNYKHNSATSERLQLAVDIITGISTNFPASSADRAIAATPGVCSMILDVWARRCDQMLPDGTLVSQCCFYAMVLFHLLSSGAVSAKDMYDTPIARRRTSSALLKMIRMFTREGDHWMDVLSTPLYLAEPLAGRSAELRDVLLSQNSTSIVCRALAVHSSRSLPSSPPVIESLESCLLSCLHYLISSMLQLHDAYACIIPAVQAGLIPSLLRCARLNSDELNEFVLIVLNFLTKHTIYPSLLRASRVALGDPVISLLENQVPRNNDIWKNWLAFRSCLGARLELKARFDEWQRKCLLVCRSAKCPNKAPPSSYRVCSGCLNVYYCSKACQKYDWKQGRHRDPCKAALQERSEGQRDSTTVLDKYFFLSVALAELTTYARSRHIDQNDPLISEISKSLAKGPERIITIDLSTCPATFTKDTVPQIASSSTDQSAKYYGTGPNPYSLSTRLKVFLVVPHGGVNHMSAYVEYVSNDLAGLIFARDAPKSTV